MIATMMKSRVLLTAGLLLGMHSAAQAGLVYDNGPLDITDQVVSANYFPAQNRLFQPKRAILPSLED